MIVATVDLLMDLDVFVTPLPLTVTLPAPRPPTLTATELLPTFLDRTFSGHDGVWMVTLASAGLPL